MAEQDDDHGDEMLGWMVLYLIAVLAAVATVYALN
jgi:hypothetical protein